MNKILIVEDERILAIEIKRKLESLGYTVTGIASSDEEAIKKSEQTNPDLILMDIILKGDMDGITAAQHIINLYSIPVIYLTAYADDEILERAMITEPYGYLLKPVNAAELKANIEMAIYKHKEEEKRKKYMKDRIIDKYYQFIIANMDESTFYSEMDIRNMLLNTFEKSFFNMKPEFEKELKKQGLNIYNDDALFLFKTYLSWISQFFTMVGIKNKIRSDDNSWYLELFNCSWNEYSDKNPIFCINCNAMVNSSFKWTNIRGKVKKISDIANNSSKCSFKFYLSD